MRRNGLSTAARRSGDESPRGLGRQYHKVFAASAVSNLGDGIGTVAYPWLASAITRNPLLIALVFVAQRLPWLVFSLPAGVITDRVDRRRAMVAMDVCRGLLTLGVAVAVLARQGTLPSPDALDAVVGTDVMLYVVVLLATLLLGMAEVLRDNSAQTILPAVVEPDRLEKANGQMWSAEAVTNTFIGPPLGSLLIIVAFSLPFVAHAATFVVAAAIMGTLSGTFRADGPEAAGGSGAEHGTTATASWRTDLVEGVRWLWAHPLLRPMAIILGVMNAALMIPTATFVLFAQEVLGVGPFLFTVIGAGGAIGSIIGGIVAPRLSARLGQGRCLALTLGGSAVVAALVAVSSHWVAVLVLFAVMALLGIVWNVITVSLRQAIIPSRLLGRANSVYRFFAWGMIPIGAALGGLTVVLAEQVVSRDIALRSTWMLAALIHVVLYVVGRSSLTTEAIVAARAAAATSTPGVTRSGDATG
jgi:MFS family permease